MPLTPIQTGAPPATPSRFRDLRIRSRREWTDLGNKVPEVAAESRVLGIHAAQQGLVPIVNDVLRLLLYSDRDTAVRRIAILLGRQLPEDTPEILRQRMAQRAEYDQFDFD